MLLSLPTLLLVAQSKENYIINAVYFQEGPIDNCCPKIRVSVFKLKQNNFFLISEGFKEKGKCCDTEGFSDSKLIDRSFTDLIKNDLSLQNSVNNSIALLEASFNNGTDYNNTYTGDDSLKLDLNESTVSVSSEKLINNGQVSVIWFNQNGGFEYTIDNLSVENGELNLEASYLKTGRHFLRIVYNNGDFTQLEVTLI